MAMSVYLFASEVPKVGQAAVGPFSNQNEIERFYTQVDRTKFSQFAMFSADQFVSLFGAAFRVAPEGEAAKEGGKAEAKQPEAKPGDKAKEPAHATHGRR
jgi:hypothetical protein